MLLYVTLGTNNMNEARRFYDAVLPILGYRRQRDAEEEIGYAADGDNGTLKRWAGQTVPVLHEHQKDARALRSEVSS